MDACHAAIADLFVEGERRGRTGLASLPQGTFRIEEEQDDGALWRAAITISPERFSVDLRGNPAQRKAPYNVSRDGAVIACQMIFKALTDRRCSPMRDRSACWR
ncbi:hydantoinase B/oxoprolinase family protein [Mesorhizobium kowhaii]|uniref:hydantoinase B/oxoprolinase family protein n=1 Tax=Mesorhizobium kowhaii TaxID=1300272 RepID=UPI003CCB2EE2